MIRCDSTIAVYKKQEREKEQKEEKRGREKRPDKEE